MRIIDTVVARDLGSGRSSQEVTMWQWGCSLVSRPVIGAVLAIFASVGLAALGCPSTPSTTSGGMGLAELLVALRNTGIDVRQGDVLEQPFFSVPGRFVNVGGEDVQVFEYASASAAEAEAARVSPDGGRVGTTAMMWAAPPHFFRKDRLIVLYNGENARVLSALRSVLGPQFAGR